LVAMVIFMTFIIFCKNENSGQEMFAFLIYPEFFSNQSLDTIMIIQRKTYENEIRNICIFASKLLTILSPP